MKTVGYGGGTRKRVRKKPAHAGVNGLTIRIAYRFDTCYVGGMKTHAMVIMLPVAVHKALAKQAKDARRSVRSYAAILIEEAVDAKIGKADPNA